MHWRTELVFQTGMDQLVTFLDAKQDHYADQPYSHIQELLQDTYDESYNCRYGKRPTTQRGIDTFTNAVEETGPGLLQAVGNSASEAGLGNLLCQELTTDLEKEIKENLVDKVLDSLRSSYVSIWEVPDAHVKEARAQLYPQIKEITDKVATLMKKKLPNSGDPAIAGAANAAGPSSSTDEPPAKKPKLG